MTQLYPSPVFGPVHSRRLGVSLGVNLMPSDRKCCSFDCIYCECGYNNEHHSTTKMPTRKEVSEKLRRVLQDMQLNGPTPDVITFAGNGEPTLHPHFAEIVDDVIRLRNELFPDCKISVLSNATRITDDKVFAALEKVDNNILKLDTVSAEYIKVVDRPVDKRYDVKAIIERLKAFSERCIIQTMFMKGTHEGEEVSNLSDKYVNPWIEAIKEIKPSIVMIYTIDRDTPSPHLEKATHEELDAIAEKVKMAGLACQVSY